MTLVAAHQPNFFPWLGFFNKIWRSDVFVILDDVQFEKSGKGSWVNRVRMANAGEAYWITVPVQRAFSGTRTIAEMRIDETQNWRKKMLRSLDLHYRRAPAFERCYPKISELVEFGTDSLFDFNFNALRQIMRLLDFNTDKIVLSSSLPIQGSATERIVSLTQAVGGSAYLSGRMAMETYQDPKQFEKAGIDLVPQNYRHPDYYRDGTFVEGLSILDALLWMGPEETSRIIADSCP